MSWSDRIEHEIMPKLRSVAKPGIRLVFESFDYGYAVGIGFIRPDAPTLSAIRFYKTRAQVYEEWWKRWMVRFRLMQPLPPIRVSVEDVGRLTSEAMISHGMRKPISETGLYDWETQQGGEP